MITRSQVTAFAAHCDTTLTLKGKTDPNLTFYKSLPICILDAVFSIGVKYASTAKVTERYIKYYNLEIPREYEKLTNEHTVSDFLKNAEEAGGAEAFADKVVCNRQRTSTRNGILKAEACFEVARVFEKHGINTLGDFQNYSQKDALERDILRVHGQSSGVMLKYLKMLAGDSGTVKPDRMIQRFINSVFPEINSHDDFQELISEAARELGSKYPDMTPRLLDHAIWEYQKNVKH